MIVAGRDERIIEDRNNRLSYRMISGEMRNLKGNQK